jgi:hypothetical protein
MAVARLPGQGEGVPVVFQAKGRQADSTATCAVRRLSALRARSIEPGCWCWHLPSGQRGTLADAETSMRRLEAAIMLTPSELAALEACGGYLSKCRPYLARQQRERRSRIVRIDYMPSADALRVLEAVRGNMGNSAMLDAIVMQWAELTGTN